MAWPFSNVADQSPNLGASLASSRGGRVLTEDEAAGLGAFHGGLYTGQGFTPPPGYTVFSGNADMPLERPILLPTSDPLVTQTASGGGLGGFMDALKNDFAPGGIPIAAAALTGGAMGGGLGAALGSGGAASGLTAADIGGGMLPEFGSNAAYASGIGSGAGGALASAGGSLMPPAMPAADPTFGGALTQTAPGVFENLANASAFGPVGAPYAMPTPTPGGLPTTAPVAAPAAKSILDQATDAAKTAAPFAPLLGAALGAGAGAIGGGSKPAGSITIEDGIPDWLKAYIKPELDKYATDVQNYNTDPYGILPSAMDEFKKTISGQYLDPSTNKYLPEYFRLGAERVKGTLSPSFGYMQAFGGNTGYNEALSRGLSDLAVGLYGGAYDKERTLQNNALTAAPGLLTGASQATFGPTQSFLDTVSGLGKERTQPYFQNQFSSILGGAMAGAGIGGLFK